MIWQFRVLTEEGRKTPHGVVIHAPGERPRWVTTNRLAEQNFKILFEREEVAANVPMDGGYQRRIFTYDSVDYLDYASTKVNLPLFILLRGRWETTESAVVILEILSEKFLETSDEKSADSGA